LRYYRLLDPLGNTSLCVETGEGQLEDITSVESDVMDISDLLHAASLSGESIDSLAMMVLESGEADSIQLGEIYSTPGHTSTKWRIDRPFDPPEVWAAGVTYKSSEMERRRESGTPDVYSNVYNADRPEIFFKSTSDRCMGPFDEVGIRGDSSWDVPEPELAFVTWKGDIVGYTIGNDMSSRSIEGENPLYLPQAKVYDRSCSIGPCFVSENSIPDPHTLTVECSIYRNGDEVFQASTSTGDMARSCSEINQWLHESNFVPDLTTVLTGTSIVPPPEFTLQEGDRVAITIESIGVLENSIIKV
jgi:2-dehydro-3-deoxy-D-arabinonate dehydratase